MRVALTVFIWIASVTCVVVAGIIAVEFGFMATAMDPTEIIGAGTEPLINALWAIVGFAGLVAATVLGLALWHSRRFKIAGVALTVCEVAAVAWACVRVYQEYF